MWNIVQRQNTLSYEVKKPEIVDVVTVFDRVISAIRRDKELVPANRFYEMRFEDLESDPVKEIRKIYQAFNLNYNQEFEDKMNTFLSGIKGFQKNIFHLTPEEKAQINSRLRHHMEHYGYSKKSVGSIQ
jgi:hypothetical protein